MTAMNNRGDLLSYLIGSTHDSIDKDRVMLRRNKNLHIRMNGKGMLIRRLQLFSCGLHELP